MTMVDGIELNLNSYIDISNFNDATYLNTNKEDLNQTLNVDIVIQRFFHTLLKIDNYISQFRF